MSAARAGASAIRKQVLCCTASDLRFDDRNVSASFRQPSFATRLLPQILGLLAIPRRIGPPGGPRTAAARSAQRALEAPELRPPAVSATNEPSLLKVPSPGRRVRPRRATIAPANVTRMPRDHGRSVMAQSSQAMHPCYPRRSTHRRARRASAAAASRAQRSVRRASDPARDIPRASSQRRRRSTQIRRARAACVPSLRHPRARLRTRSLRRMHVLRTTIGDGRRRGAVAHDSRREYEQRCVIVTRALSWRRKLSSANEAGPRARLHRRRRTATRSMSFSIDASSS